MASIDSNFDALARALYGGATKAVDFKAMPGDSVAADLEAGAMALLASMTRLGIVVDGHLKNLEAN
ncbi:MAG TPA: hypothetical protein PKE25_00570 [Novosphingobium sp.]|nr:hypothetical protein [Novosphingobium sp.]